MGDKYVEVFYDQDSFVGDNYREPDTCAEITPTGRKWDSFWCVPHTQRQEGSHPPLHGALSVNYKERGDLRYPRDGDYVNIRVLEDPDDINSKGDKLKCSTFSRESTDDAWTCKTVDGDEFDIETEEIGYVG